MRMLSMFCGEGLACWGYWLSGRFHEVVGVDINPELKRSYAFDFIASDALSLDYNFLLDFDFIHASPPCQAYSKMTPDQSIHPRLIKPTLTMLHATGLPYVVENVEGSGHELRPNLRLYGRDVGLSMSRPRYFNISIDHKINVLPGDNMNTRQVINETPISHFMSSCQRINEVAATHIHGSKYLTRQELIDVFGLDCIPPNRRKLLTMRGIEQGIPPAMTKAIAERIFPAYKAMIG